MGDLVLRDARGKVVSARVGMLARQVGMRPVEWNAPQPAGTFVLEATTDAGHQRSWPVDLSGSAPGARLRFSLR